MRALIVYESMYGNTRRLAEAIGRGLARSGEATVVPVDRATPALVAAADLVVVGGPTHAHSMSRASTRKAAVEQAAKPDAGLVVEPSARGSGVREWLDALGPLQVRSAAFDTRVDAPAALTGRASKGIAKQLRRHGSSLAVGPESFLVDKHNRLEPGEETRAEAWGAGLAERMAGAASVS